MGQCEDEPLTRAGMESKKAMMKRPVPVLDGGGGRETCRCFLGGSSDGFSQTLSWPVPLWEAVVEAWFTIPGDNRTGPTKRSASTVVC